MSEHHNAGPGPYAGTEGAGSPGGAGGIGKGQEGGSAPGGAPFGQAGAGQQQLGQQPWGQPQSREQQQPPGEAPQWAHQGGGYGQQVPPMYVQGGSGHGGGFPPGMGAGAGAVPGGSSLLSGLTGLFDFNDREFWKGALVGAAAVLLLTNDSVQRTLFRGAVRGRDAVQAGVDKVRPGSTKPGQEAGDE